MRWTIFSRLMVVYLGIFLLMLAANLYALSKLREIHQTARTIQDVDNRLIELKKSLSDSLFSQLQYEKKYLITRDNDLYERFLAARAGFEKDLSRARRIAGTPSQKEALDRLKASYDRYQTLFAEEKERAPAGRPSSSSPTEKEKKAATDRTLNELERLEAVSRNDIAERMRELSDTGSSTRSAAAMVAAVAAVLVIGLSFFITRGITRPLSLLIAKTGEVSDGVFSGNLAVASPPEIAELSRAFNAMCDRLKAVDRLKSDFFSSMSHELRTPLTSIKMGINLLQTGLKEPDPDKQKKLLTILASESDRLIGLVNSMLDLSKMEAGMMTYRFEPLPLAPLIEKVVTEVAPLVEARRIRFETESAEGIPILRVDRERILQALRNLIGNALKFTPAEGRIRVAARPGKVGVEVSVADTGPGIPRENLKTIFDKYRQGPSGGSSPVKGTGLGLAIAKHVILSHGGEIWVESEPGRGSTFTFSLRA
jgi:two-component system, NtrC family, sensor histidine kinase GlrK